MPPPPPPPPQPVTSATVVPAAVSSGHGTFAASFSGTKRPMLHAEEKPGGIRRLPSDCSMVVGQTRRFGREEFEVESLLCTASKSSTEKGKAVAKTRTSTASHSQYERNRRQKINQKMKALQKLVPNSHQSDDKASLLDKAIDYIKHWQAHGQMLNQMMQGAPQIQMMNNFNQTATPPDQTTNNSGLIPQIPNPMWMSQMTVAMGLMQQMPFQGFYQLFPTFPNAQPNPVCENATVFAAGVGSQQMQVRTASDVGSSGSRPRRPDKSSQSPPVSRN